MEVELLWRRPNAPSVALRGGLRFLWPVYIRGDTRASMPHHPSEQQIRALQTGIQ